MLQSILADGSMSVYLTAYRDLPRFSAAFENIIAIPKGHDTNEQKMKKNQQVEKEERLKTKL